MTLALRSGRRSWRFEGGLDGGLEAPVHLERSTLVFNAHAVFCTAICCGVCHVTMPFESEIFELLNDQLFDGLMDLFHTGCWGFVPSDATPAMSFLLESRVSSSQ